MRVMGDVVTNGPATVEDGISSKSDPMAVYSNKQQENWNKSKTRNETEKSADLEKADHEQISTEFAQIAELDPIEVDKIAVKAEVILRIKYPKSKDHAVVDFLAELDDQLEQVKAKGEGEERSNQLFRLKQIIEHPAEQFVNSEEFQELLKAVDSEKEAYEQKLNDVLQQHLGLEGVAVNFVDKLKGFIQQQDKDIDFNDLKSDSSKFQNLVKQFVLKESTAGQSIQEVLEKHLLLEEIEDESAENSKLIDELQQKIQNEEWEELQESLGNLYLAAGGALSNYADVGEWLDFIFAIDRYGTGVSRSFKNGLENKKSNENKEKDTLKQLLEVFGSDEKSNFFYSSLAKSLDLKGNSLKTAIIELFDFSQVQDKDKRLNEVKEVFFTALENVQQETSFGLDLKEALDFVLTKDVVRLIIENTEKHDFSQAN